jgi:hypothetical protein
MHMIGSYVISCIFSSHQVFYNLLPCYPIPIGPCGPKTLVVHLQNFQKNLVSSSIVLILTFQILVILPNIN